jgi:ribonuclease HI
LSNLPVNIYFDGGSRGNPGPAAGAAYADYESGHEKFCYLEHATNNEAEYRGLLMAIELAKELKLQSVQFLGDSKLVVMQVTGEWKAKHPMMNELRIQVMAALSTLPRWQIGWVRREQNSEADRVANQAMDQHSGMAPIPSFEKAAPGKAETKDKVKTAIAPSEPGAVRADIQKLNNLAEKASFKDFSALKVGGMDQYSRSNPEALQGLLPNFDELSTAFMQRSKSDKNSQDMPEIDRTKLVINALRWTARGLNPELAIRKVLVDLEVTNNIRNKKTK